MAQSTSGRVIYRVGTLHVLDPVSLPEGIEIELPSGSPESRPGAVHCIRRALGLPRRWRV
jgi:hypothetical protein